MNRKINIKKIIEENRRRHSELEHFYNPVTGEGSPIERFKLIIRDDNVVYLPMAMLDDYVVQESVKHEKGFHGFIKEVAGEEYTEKMFDNSYEELTKLRLHHDVEYWSYTCVKIKDKISGQDIPFIMNYPQRKYLKALEKERLANRPIRIVIDKARQWGGSTLTQVYMAWIQSEHKTGWNSAICADVEDQARNIRGMYTKLAKNLPKNVAKMTFRPYEGSSKNRVITERNCIVGVGSMQKPDNLRSFDFAMLHLSEVGLWKKTDGKSPDDLAQNLRAGIPNEPYTLVVLESTAKGVGNFFHREFLTAVNGTSEDGYVPVFVSWWEIEMYQMAISNLAKFISHMDEKAWELWDEGATLEGIKWYQTFKKRENYDDWRMGSEFPTTWQESFQSTGRRAFAPSYVRKARLNNRDPEHIGELYANSITGPECLKGIRFEKNIEGRLKIWSMPDKSEQVANRYGLFADIGGRSLGADWSVIRVIDRYWMMEGGPPEMVATWRGHLDQDIFAWKVAQLGKFYNDGLVAIEVNSLRTEKGEGDHHYTILQEISEYYDNLFARGDPEKYKEGAPIKWGFHTNMKSKPMIIDIHNAAMRDDLYIETDSMACDEADTYEIKEDGTYGAVEGSHDDLEVTTAGAIWLALRHMDAVKYMRSSAAKLSKPILGEASF